MCRNDSLRGATAPAFPVPGVALNMGSVVLLPALLRTIHMEAKCEVLARKNPLSGGSLYSEGFVLNAPPGLPNGEYLVYFDGHLLRATKRSGLWLTSTEIVRQAA